MTDAYHENKNIISNNTTFEEELNTNGFIVYTNVGVSMLPLIRENRDVLTIRKVQPDDLRKREIVLFKHENIKGRGRYVLHRIIKVLPDGKFFIAGDNCTSGETVKAEQVIGVLGSIRRGDKEINLSGFRYKAYVLLWCTPFRMRSVILRFKKFVGRYFRAVMRRFRMVVKK